MGLDGIIGSRRAYRSLAPAVITQEIMDELAKAAQLTCSCFNNQPWRFVFARGEEALSKVKEALNAGNAWAKSASMIIAVFAKKEKDCVIKEREYYLFDTGMAAYALILKATELGLVAHPIAGYDPEKAKQALGIPADFMLITLINVGKKSEAINPVMSEKQVKEEKERPPRRPLEQIYSVDKYDVKLDT